MVFNDEPAVFQPEVGQKAGMVFEPFVRVFLGEILSRKRAQQGRQIKEEEQKPTQEDKKTSTRSTIEKLVDGICSTEAIIEKLVDEISKSHDLVAKQQEQMDRVLTMLESERTDKGELEKILKKKYEGSLK